MSYAAPMRPAVFLDRDDTIIANREVTAATAHPGDLTEPALVRLLPGAGAALRRLADAGFVLVVVSNQGGVAMGVCTLEQVEAVNDRMRELLAREGVALAGVYYSPARPGGTVARFAGPDPWRKPAPGMILAAANELGLDLARSWMIGDAPRDVEAAVAAGIAPGRCIQIGRDVPGLEAAAERVLAHVEKTPTRGACGS